jgi:hypothetical protein
MQVIAHEQGCTAVRVSGGDPARLSHWGGFTFAGYGLVHKTEPRRDLDLASYGLVRLLPDGPGTGQHGLGWEPKLAFRALAELG